MTVNGLEELLRRLLAYAAAGRRIVLACAALSFAGTLSAAYPVTAVVVPATLLAARKWWSIACVSALGSALGATALIYIFHHLGWNELYAHFPELGRSESWAGTADWVARYGVFALFLIALSPLPQTPALLLFGAVRQDYAGVFIALLLGKLIKYGVFAWTASHFPEQVSRGIGRLLRHVRPDTNGNGDGDRDAG